MRLGRPRCLDDLHREGRWDRQIELVWPHWASRPTGNPSKYYAASYGRTHNFLFIERWAVSDWASLWAQPKLANCDCVCGKEQFQQAAAAAEGSELSVSEAAAASHRLAPNLFASPSEMNTLKHKCSPVNRVRALHSYNGVAHKILTPTP